MQVRICTPDIGTAPQFWEAWGKGMVELVKQFRQVSLSQHRKADLCVTKHMIQVHPNNGMFISNCPHHVSHNNPAVWGYLQAISPLIFQWGQCQYLDNFLKILGSLSLPQVPVLDGGHQPAWSGWTVDGWTEWRGETKRVTYKQALANWLKNLSPFQAQGGPEPRLCIK